MGPFNHGIIWEVFYRKLTTNFMMQFIYCYFFCIFAELKNESL